MSTAPGDEDPATAPHYIQNLLNDLGSEFSKKESRLQLVERQLNETMEALKRARHDFHREKSLRLEEVLSANVSLQRDIRELQANNAALKMQVQEFQIAVTTLKRQGNGGRSKCLSTPPSSSANASFEGAVAVDEAGISHRRFGQSQSSTPLGQECEAAWQILSNVHADAAEEDARVKDEERRFFKERARAWEERQLLKSTLKTGGAASIEGCSGTAAEREKASRAASCVEEGSSARPLSVDTEGTRPLATSSIQPAIRKAKVQYVDANALCCYLCKRTFKTVVQLRNHANSDRHKQSLTDPRHLAKADARMAKRAKDAAEAVRKAQLTQTRDGMADTVQVEAGADPSTRLGQMGDGNRGGTEACSLARSLSVEIISSHADDPMDEDYEGSFSCDGSMHET